jgi:hypothetical protein
MIELYGNLPRGQNSPSAGLGVISNGKHRGLTGLLQIDIAHGLVNERNGDFSTTIFLSQRQLPLFIDLSVSSSSNYY